MDVKLMLLFLIILIIVVLSNGTAEKLWTAYQHILVRPTGRRHQQH